MNWKKINLYGGLILAMFFWAFSFVWYKIAFRHLDPMALVFFRLLVAAVFITILLIITGRFEKIQKKDYRVFLLMVFIEPLVYFLGESYGMQLISSTIGAIIISFIPLLTPILAYMVYKEKLSWFNFAGLVISFIGVLMVLIGKDFSLNAPLAGIALLSLATICAVSYSAVVVYLAKKYRPLTIIWIQNVWGMLLFLPLFLILDLEETLKVQWSWEVISPVIKLGIFPSALSFIFYNLAIREIGITRANIFTYFIPVITAILSYFILKEDMSALKIIGIVIVIAGLMISQQKKKVTSPKNTKLDSLPFVL